MSRNSLTGLALLLVLAAGCMGRLDEQRPAADAGAASASDAAPQTLARVAFERDVANLLTNPRPKGACIICHQGDTCPNGGGSCFLGADTLNHYGALVTALAVGNGDPLISRGIPAASRFLQRGDHLGNSFCTGPGVPYANCTQNEVQLIADWINLESAP